MGTHNEDYITTFATIPAVRPPLGDELLSPEGTTTITAVASLYEDPGLINEVHRLGGNRYDFHLFIIAEQCLKLHHSILQGEQGIVSTAPDILSWMDTGPMLAYEDAPGLHTLTCEPFDT